jgi:hypothetical protein
LLLGVLDVSENSECYTKDPAFMPSHKGLESPPVARKYPLYEKEIVLIGDSLVGSLVFLHRQNMGLVLRSKRFSECSEFQLWAVTESEPFLPRE